MNVLFMTAVAVIVSTGAHCMSMKTSDDVPDANKCGKGFDHAVDVCALESHCESQKTPNNSTQFYCDYNCCKYKCGLTVDVNDCTADETSYWRLVYVDRIWGMNYNDCKQYQCPLM